MDKILDFNTKCMKRRNKIKDLKERIKDDLKLEYGITDRSIEQIKKYFEERCK